MRARQIQARLLGLRVRRVSWGFWGRVACVERRGVTYRLGRIPIGIYVKICDSVEDLAPATVGESNAATLPPEEKLRGLVLGSTEKPVEKKATD